MNRKKFLTLGMLASALLVLAAYLYVVSAEAEILSEIAGFDVGKNSRLDRKIERSSRLGAEGHRIFLSSELSTQISARQMACDLVGYKRSAAANVKRRYPVLAAHLSDEDACVRTSSADAYRGVSILQSGKSIILVLL